MRDGGEPVAEAEHGVAAEVAQDVGVLLQYGHLHARPGQDQPEEQPGGSAPDDTDVRIPTHAVTLCQKIVTATEGR